MNGDALPGLTNVRPLSPSVTADTGNFTPRPEVIDSMIYHESRGNPRAVSPKGARGLMQIMPETALQYGVHPDQLFDPKINRELGTRYYGDLLKKYKGNENLAQIAYNSGPGRVDKGEFVRSAVDHAHNVLTRAAQMVSDAMGGTAYAAEGPPGLSGVHALGSKPAAAPANVPSGLTNIRKLPYGMKTSMHFGPVTVTQGSDTTTGEMTKEQQFQRTGQQLLKLGSEMQELYERRIKPKLAPDAGPQQLSSVGQGLEYTEPGPMRAIGHEIDPDVKEWITKSGQFGQALSNFYAAGTGARPGVQFFTEISSPHAPHAPSGVREVVGFPLAEQQWDLQKQGEQLPVLMHNIQRDLGQAPQEHYQQWTPAEQDLLKKHGF